MDSSRGYEEMPKKHPKSLIHDMSYTYASRIIMQ